LLIFSLLFSVQNVSGQNKKFVGRKILREGNNIAFQTIPEISNQSVPILNNLSGKKHNSSEPRYVLSGNIIWSFQDAEAIDNFSRLNANGSIPVVGWGLNNMRVSRYTAVNNVPDWEYATVPNDPCVDISNGFIAVTRGTEFDVLDTTGTVLFQNPLPDSLYAFYATISRDGSRAVFLVQALGNGNTGLIYMVDLSGTPSISWSINVPYNVIGNWTGAAFSASGNRLVVNGRYHIYVIDPDNGSIIWDNTLDNSEAPSVISGDGNVIVTADLNGFVQTRIFDSGTNEYNVLWQYHVPAGSFTNWASSVGISADGSTVVAGSLIFVNSVIYDGTIIAFDTFGDGTPKWIYGGVGDLVDDIALSDDGRVAAAVTWGDLNNQTKPDLLVFDVASGDLTYSLATPGSFFTVDISQDGSKVFAGGKAVHAREFGSGGLAYYVNINLGGGNISGHVSLSGTSDFSGVKVKAEGTVRSAITNPAGDYTIYNVPAGTYTVTAGEPGYNFGSVSNIVVTDGNTTSGINFSLTAFPSTAPTLTASNDSNGNIVLNFIPSFEREKFKKEIAKAVGDDYPGANTLYTNQKAIKDGNRITELNKEEQNASSPLLADSLAIYRSTLTGGPYTRITSVDAALENYTDTSALPLTNYYYVITLFNDIGESEYSNEVVGMINDSLLTSSVVAPMATVPTIDGVLSPGEWDDAVKVDISDVLGFGSSPKPRGSVFMYLKYNTQTQMLYVAGEDFLNHTLDDNEGFGLYFDDNNNNNFESQIAPSIEQEGNFWAYWHPSGSNLRFRQIFTGGGVGTVDTIQGAQVAFSDGSGHLQGEVAIPMGFMQGYQLQVYGPNNTVGLGAFLIERDNGAAVFNGWWPQTMHSLFIPSYFGDVNINIQLPSPPQIPGNIAVNKQGSNLLLSWADPTLGLNNYPLPSQPTMDVYKDGVFYSRVNSGVQSVLDNSIGCGQWGQYALDAFIVQNGDTMVSPISIPVGNFACFNPPLTTIAYDDSTWEYFTFVSPNDDNNKFGVRFTPTFYPARVIRLSTLVNSWAPFDFTIQSDSLGSPTNRIIAGPYRVMSTSTNVVSNVVFTLPGDDPPLIASGDFWVVINYLHGSPLAPGIGVDNDPPYPGRDMYYTRTDGWVSIVNANLMVSAYITDTTTVSENEQVVNEIPKTYNLMQNYPNPFNPTTLISYQLPESQMVTIEIYNSLGEKVRTLTNGIQSAGYHTIQWKGDNNAGNSVASGMYLYRMTAGKFVSVKKMLLLR